MTTMKSKYISPMIQVFVLSNESVIMSGSQDVSVTDVATIYDESGNGVQLSKRRNSLFDDEEYEDDNW